MKTMAHRQGLFVCQLCKTSRASANRKRLFAILAQPLSTSSRTFTHIIPTNSIPVRRRNIRDNTQPFVRDITRQKSAKAGTSRTSTDPATTLQSLVEDAKKLETSTTIPDELDVLELLERCQNFSQVVVFGQAESNVAAAAADEDKSSPASSLLDLDESNSSHPETQNISSSATTLSKPFRERASSLISEISYTLMSDPRIFITPPMLQLCVHTQALLGRAEYLPEIFHLYANKPLPNPGTSNPITYRQPSPRSPKNAIPIALADAALDAAIARKDLPLALSVIDTTVCAPAFLTNKILRKATAPLIALGVTPVCAYAGATALANWQNTYDVNIATYMAMAAIMAYVGTLSVIGFVAVTTSNDQMERVVWQPGLRLRDRWLREDERLYFDRLALAWGFKERWRRGEEQGEDWEALREFCGRRQMVLDKSDLIEGME